MRDEINYSSYDCRESLTEGLINFSGVKLLSDLLCSKLISFRNVDTSILNNKQQAALHFATEQNKIKVLKTMAPFRDQFDPNQGGEYGRTALHIAAIYDFAECASILV